MTNKWDSNPGGGLQSSYLYPLGCRGETSSSIPVILCLRHNSLISGSQMKDFHHHHHCYCVMWLLNKQFQAFKYLNIHLPGATCFYSQGKSRHMNKSVSLSNNRMKVTCSSQDLDVLTASHSSDHTIKLAQISIVPQIRQIYSSCLLTLECVFH